MRTSAEALLPHERYEALDQRTPSGGMEHRIEWANRIIGKQCSGLGEKTPISEDTLWRLLNGQRGESSEVEREGLRRLEYARDGMGWRDYRALYENAGIPLEMLAKWKREAEGTEPTRDAVNGWLNAKLREEEDAAEARSTEEQVKRVGTAAVHQQLTIIVGAGASKASPANVPLYGELAEKWGATEKEKKNPGRFFDRVKAEKGYYLHREIAKELKEFVTPSRVHEVLIQLNAEAGARNLITTNWDQLLEVALRDQKVDVDVWPRERREPGAGREAAGIVHIHGNVEEPEGMIVTEQEMKEHYSEGRTPDEVGFLTEILEGRTVLYVGYSHGDAMIAEIQRKVGQRERGRAQAERPQSPQRETWSLVRREGPPETWAKRLETMRGMGIKPITYKDHKDLPQLLEVLLKQVKEDAVWDQARLERMGKEGASDNTDWSEVTALLTHGGARLRHFLRSASPTQWQDERFVKGGAAKVFGEGQVNEAGHQLARWLCHEIDEEKVETLLWMMSKSGGTMGPLLWHTLGLALHQDQGRVHPQTMETMATLMIQRAKKFESLHHAGTVIQWLAKRCQKDKRVQPTLEGWRILIEPKLVTKIRLKDFESEVAVECGAAKPALTLESWETHQFWKNALKKVLREVNQEAWEIGLSCMEEYQRLADAGQESQKGGWNGWAWGRKHIRPHEQNRGRTGTAEGAVIASMYKAMDQIGVAEKDRREWKQRVRRMARSKAALARRLAVDAVEQTTHWTASEKLLWAATHSRMNDYEIHTEIWKLCRRVFREADDEARAQFWKRVETMRPGGKRYHDNMRYRLLCYFVDGGITDENVTRGMQELEAKYPGLKPSPHPELGSWSISGPVNPRAPEGWSSEEIIERWTRNQARAVNWIVREWAKPVAEEGDPWDFNRANEDGRRNAVEETLEKAPEIGLELARTLKRRKDWEHPAWSVVCGQAGKILSEKQILKLVVGLIDQKVVGGKEGRACGDIAMAAQNRAHQEGWAENTREALQLTFTEWLPALVQHDGDPRGNDLGMWTINTAAGKAVEAILTLTGVREAGDRTNERVLEGLHQVASQNTTLMRHLRVAAGSHIGWLDHTSTEWTRENIIERIETVSEHSEARREWWTGLAHANMTQRVFDLMRASLRREVKFKEPKYRDGRETEESDADTGARLYAVSVARDNLYDKKQYTGQELSGLGKERREAVVQTLCGDFWRHEEFQKAEGWQKVLSPMWEEILERGGATGKEQSAFLDCFPFISPAEQTQFRERFVAGPRVPPDHMLEYIDGTPGQVTVEAALEVAIHCAGAYAEHEGWAWSRTLEKVQEWMRTPRSSNEVKLAERLFAMTGWQR